MMPSINLYLCQIRQRMLPPVLLLCCALTGNAQVILNSPVTGPLIVTARNSITLTDGFSANGANGAVHLSIVQGPSADCVPLAALPSADQNYITTFVPRAAITDATQLVNMNTCQVMQTIQYLDGLGRPLQTVQVKGSLSATADIIQPVAYDQFGRSAVKFLPYTTTAGNAGSYRADALTGGQSAFYATSVPTGVTPIPNPYAATAFEASPMNRVVEQGAPGDAWQLTGTVNADGVASGHTTKMSYANNDAASLTTGSGYWARQYSVAIDATTGARTLIDKGTYGVDQLDVTVNYDENWVSANGKSGTSETFTDQLGHTVVKRIFNGTQILSTYYVYDDFGNLSFVLTPGVTADNGNITQSVLNDLCYQYKYDERQRLIEKKLPGKDWEYMVYNTLDQVVATQDANQHSGGQWSFTKYDGLGRVVYSGVWNNGGTAMDRLTLQGTVNGQTTLWETYTGTGTGYTSGAWPQNNIVRYLVLNYYDGYTFPGNPYSPTVSPTLTGPTGLLTATKTAVLLPDGTYGSMLWAVNYYDDKGRTVETYKQHYLGGEAGVSTSNYDEAAMTYDFSNEVTGTIRHHYTTANLSAPALTIGNSYTYDHMGRKTQTWEAITVGSNPSPPSLLLSQLDYNEIGQVLTKHLHSENNGSSFLQDIGYTYNERGWLRTSGTSANGTSTNLLHIDLRYNSADAATQQFNGNIAEMHYTGPTSGTKVFGYTYDPLNRLTIAASTGGTLDERIAYDNLGNITGLRRGGVPYGALTYTYENGNQSNRLSSVTGAGFTTRNYSYDFNGNATSDGGSNLAYNLLNLPQSLTSGGSTVATYTYDATGNKLRSSGNLGGTWDYISGINYKSGGIDNITTEEGRVAYNSGNPKYEYDLKDHLGNVRVSFAKSPTTNAAEVVQEDEYYAFGLRHGLVDNSNDNRYLYNGKEYQKDLKDQYDYGARFYDPVIGRFTTVDAYAEKYSSMTPYQYAGDSPVLLSDMHGDSVIVNESLSRNKEAMKDFNLFANSKAGRKFLSKYAAKGQKIGGYTFTKNGSYNDKGVDLIYQVGLTKIENAVGKTVANTDNYGGDTPVGGRLRETVTLDYSQNPLRLKGDDLTMNMTETIFHESFIHVDQDTRDYLDDGHLNGSDLAGKAKSMFNQYQGTAQHQQSVQDANRYGQNSLFYGQGMDALKSINQKMQTHYSVQRLMGLMNKGVNQ